MSLQTPPAYDQLSITDPSRSNDCGETVLAALMTALGVPWSPTGVLAWFKSNGISGETSAADLGRFLDAQHVPHTLTAHNDDPTARGAYAIVLISSDAGGNPTPGSAIGHWLLQYSTNKYMNPYGGRYAFYVLGGADRRLAIEVSAAAAEGTIEHSPQGGALTEDTPMTPDERVDVARALTRLTYAAAAHRAPETQEAEDQLVARAAGDPSHGFDFMVRDLLKADEFVADMAHDAAQEPHS